MIKIRKKKAQQVVEFLLVAPILIIFLGILTEYAYALNINMTLTKALKTVTASIYSEIKPNMSSSDINTLVSTNLKTYLDNNAVPTASENNIRVSSVNIDSNSVFMATYTYIPAFTLPNVWFKFLPDKFDFFASSAVPSAFLKPNNYNSSTNSLVLDKIWSSTSDFSSADSFNDSKNGILKDNAGRASILFLIPTTAPTLTDAYVLADWNGILKKDFSGTFTYTLDLATGDFYQCTSLICNPEPQNFYDYITTQDYYNLFLISKADAPSDINNLSSIWLTPSGAIDLSNTSVSGLLKNTLTISKNGNSLGNYDNIGVSAFNSSISATNDFKMKSYGSFVLIYSTEDISKINATIKTKNYDFGG